MRVCNVGAAVVSHYVGVATCPRWRVVDGTTLVSKKSALVVLVDHYLILFINIKDVTRLCHFTKAHWWIR